MIDDMIETRCMTRTCDNRVFFTRKTIDRNGGVAPWAFCDTCEQVRTKLRQQLALEIQELHALALLYPDATRRFNDGDPIRRKISAAEARVEKLHYEIDNFGT